MKKIILITLIALCTLPLIVSAQAIGTPKKSSASTYEKYTRIQFGTDSSAAYMYIIGQDTVIDGVAYLKVFMPAGNNNIGNVDIASIAAGTNNIGDVDIASIAAGDNNIGNIDIATIAAGSNTIGGVLQAGTWTTASTQYTETKDTVLTISTSPVQLFSYTGLKSVRIIPNTAGNTLYVGFDASVATQGDPLNYLDVWSDTRYTNLNQLYLYATASTSVIVRYCK